MALRFNSSDSEGNYNVSASTFSLLDLNYAVATAAAACEIQLGCRAPTAFLIHALSVISTFSPSIWIDLQGQERITA